MSTTPRTPPTRTPPQVTASNPKNSVWVSANAGTGKTQVLTDRITRLLLTGVKAERILCLTFTKAAASEMLTRLSSRLGSWAMAKDDQLTKEITSLLGKVPEKTLLAPARRLFAETLDVPGGLKIRTIHSFCESLLGRFPIEANIAPNFSIIDERTAAELMNEAQNRLLTQANKTSNTAIMSSLKQISGHINQEDFTTLMSDLSSQRNRLQSLLRHYGSVKAVTDASRRTLGLKPSDTAQNIIEQACDRANFNQEDLLAVTEAMSTGSLSEKVKAKNLEKWLKGDKKTRIATFCENYKPVYLTKSNEPRKKLVTKKTAGTNPDLFRVLKNEQQRIFQINELLCSMDIFLVSEAIIHIGYKLIDTFEQLKKTRSLLDYDDLILNARDLMQSEGGASWVHYKLDGGLDHILVDEAQDTSQEQWDVIKALAGDFFTGLSAKESERTVFAVGDEKQSIYSFQGADPFMFGNTSEHFSRKALNANKTFRRVELERSYRSTESILKTVDKIFENGKTCEGLTFNDKSIVHQWERQGQAGLVELWPTFKKSKTIEVKPWDAPLDRLPVDSPQDRLAKQIASTIRGWLDDGEELLSAGRPIREGDIMILVRQRSNFTEKLINTLKKYNIPVAGADRMILTEQLAVMDLLALGRFVLLPEDDLTLAIVLKGPLFGFTDNDDLFPLAYQRKGTLWDALKKESSSKTKYKAAYTRLAELQARADYTPPFEFYAQLLGPDGARKDLLARLGQEAEDPIDEFLNLTLDFEREHVPSLQGFLNWIEAGRTQIKRDLDQGRGEVRVMTVHGSKGLQGNIVFLPDTCSVPTSRQETRLRWVQAPEPALLWGPPKQKEESRTAALSEQNKQLRAQEYRRLLYVALTRARDRLYISGWEGNSEPTDDCWYKLIEPTFKKISEEVLKTNGEKIYRLSNPQEARPDSKDEYLNSKITNTPNMPNWATRPAAQEPIYAVPVSPSQLEAKNTENSLYDHGGNSRFMRGIVIHRLLESLPNIEPEKRVQAAHRYLRRPIHNLNKKEQNAIAADVMAVMEDPDFKTLFGQGTFSEVPISGTINGCIVTGRIDRIAINDRKITIIDYKTNRSPPKKTKDVSPVYIKQMATYRSLLRDIYPKREIVCVLAWTNSICLMTLPNELLDQYTS